MKFFSYALVYALVCFVLYLVFKLFRFAYVRVKAFVIRRKLSKLVDTEKKADSEKKDD